MRSILLLGIGAAALCGAASDVPLVGGDPARGQELFTSEMCVSCHSVNGKGGRTAPDLGKRTGRNYTPDLFASLLWNHAPAMWSAMQNQAVAKTTLNDQAAADLFAYFYAARRFERPGDAGRGKQAWSARHCAECHAISGTGAGPGKPVNSWESLGDPLIMAQQMWNHSSNMRDAFRAKQLAWPRLTGQELTDILVYLQNLPETRNLAANFTFPPIQNGATLFQEKGCAGCHRGKLELSNRLHGRSMTLTDVAVTMWNHADKMAQVPPTLNQEEMRQIVAYVWSKQFSGEDGNAGRGKHIFTAKNCATCHNDPSSGAPNLASRQGSYSAVSMVAALWNHGPGMLRTMQQKNIPWPRFDGNDMADLIAYLNSGK
jgi:mono/diheme cytochrome c family protein